jgi:DNA-binding transcriptional LysR family regulator
VLNWNDLKYCLALDRHGSMFNAGKSLQVNVATVSRRIEQITKDVGQTLFIRNGQEWQATVMGAELVTLAREVDARLPLITFDDTEELARDAVIKLSVSLTIMQTFMQNIASFRGGGRTPLNVDLTVHDRNLAYSETDVAVRYTRPQHGNYVCAKVSSLDVCPYVSSHSDSFPTDWLEIDYDGVAVHPKSYGFDLPIVPKMRMEGLTIAAQSMAHGNYMGFFPTEFGDQNPELRRATNKSHCQSLDIWMVYHKARQLDPAVRAGVEMIQQCFISSAPNARM